MLRVQLAALLAATLLGTGCAHGRHNQPTTIPEGFDPVPELMWSWCTMATETADYYLPDRPRRRFALWTPQTRALALPDECDELRESYFGPADLREHELLPGARKPGDIPDPWRVLVGEDKRILLNPARVTWIAVSGDGVEVFWSVGAWSSDEDRYLLLRGRRPGTTTVAIQHLVRGRIEIELETFSPGGR